MQTLQCFAGSLQDHANLQKLREKLQDIPKRLLSRSDESEDYLLGNVSGDYNYHFTFKLEGGGVFQTGVLVASAENAPGGLPVPLKCKWRRRVGDMRVEIPSVTSNMYQISADDVGTDIQVEAIPADADDGHLGSAFGEIGPFELDPSTRRSLDNALGSGASRFVVAQSKLPGDRDNSRSEMVIHVSAESVKVVPMQGGSEVKSREVASEYSPDYPKVIIHPLDTCKFQLIMDHARIFHLQAQSRTSRDLIALTVRCFHAKKYLSTNDILQELFPVNPMGQGAPASGSSHLDECILLERLTKELNRSMQQKDTSEKVLRNTHHEKRQLQAQLEETITGFQEVIEGLEVSTQGPSLSTTTSSMPVERLQEQYREVKSQNQALEAELQTMRRQLEEAQRSNKAATAAAGGPGGRGLGGASSVEVSQLREERNHLQARLRELSSSSGQQRDQADQVHTQELKRLRQDVETLHNQKEALRKQLQDGDRARQELQENFLYVKGQLDKVQMKQAQTTAGAGGESKEFERFRENISTVSEERNRLCNRMETLSREIEKEKAYHESSLERVMTANARLMEERDRAEKEVQRLSKLYAESVQQVQSPDTEISASTGVFRLDSTASSPVTAADQEEMNNVRKQLAQIEEAIKRKDQENESLKNRIRKLAVA
mmetsp:Transcript_14345/g.25223  ORF Transcript_14345/g.25223 Transcript_14345/m.25223 type:complete len:661 (-) Transcript_14345:73-2055(-)